MKPTFLTLKAGLEFRNGIFNPTGWYATLNGVKVISIETDTERGYVDVFRPKAWTPDLRACPVHRLFGKVELLPVLQSHELTAIERGALRRAERRSVKFIDEP